MTSLITDDGKVNFAEIEIFSRNKDGKFYTPFNTTRVREVDEVYFLNLLVATAQAYAASKSTNSEKIIKTRYERYKFYENQIDLTKGDMFTALLYDFDCWIFL